MTWQLNDDYIVNSSSESWNVERKCELSGPSKAKLGRAGVKQWTGVSSVFLFCCHSVTKLCPTLCNPMDYSTPGFPVLHSLPEFAQTHVY